ncbi:hypothetical protein [Bacillus inaquosorum]|uniref:hypothetical protein n=1 Tax=Bacillus inaquosorum TaxID=483913 RepID=UPI0022814539|nr:hypothetical protein [Bacillus inaquosorum]MCY8146882.1 hypothetical protein [Bacillus inaquosorum]MCY8281305.1 hypothetical protein [Bacillus inaquosorum]
MLSVEARNKIKLLMKLTRVIFAVAVLTSVLSFSTFDVGTNNELIKITLDRVAALKKTGGKIQKTPEKPMKSTT